MERFLTALSLTVLLSGLSAVAQVEPASHEVNQAISAGLMSPSGNGDFRADEVLTRAELAAILVKTFGLDRQPPLHQAKSAPIPMPQDVSRSHWAYNDIQTVLSHGIMTGYREGRFFPEQRVTRAEAFSIFAQAYGVFQFPKGTIDNILDEYPDAAQIPYWARKPMATALSEGFVNQATDRTIRPLDPMTRQDMAHALAIYLKQQTGAIEVPWPIRTWLNG